MEDGVQLKQNYYTLTLDGVIASRGGIPLIEKGKLIGAIGCSGRDRLPGRGGVQGGGCDRQSKPQR